MTGNTRNRFQNQQTPGSDPGFQQMFQSHKKVIKQTDKWPARIMAERRGIPQVLSGLSIMACGVYLYAERVVSAALRIPISISDQFLFIL